MPLIDQLWQADLDKSFKPPDQSEEAWDQIVNIAESVGDMLHPWNEQLSLRPVDKKRSETKDGVGTL